MELDEPKILTRIGTNGTLESIKKWVKETIQKANKFINEKTKFKEAAAKAQAKVKELREKSKNKVIEILQNTNRIVENLVTKSKATKVCVERSRPQFKAIIENTNKDIENCNQNALNKLQAAGEKFQNQIDGLISKIDTLGKVMADCYKNSNGELNIYKCMFKLVSAINQICLHNSYTYIHFFIPSIMQARRQLQKSFHLLNNLLKLAPKKLRILF